ncbi:Metallo-dependent phosphatase [Panus rudis PR-1116 ss-1]|nr:Metallo-dependent phosphatase [Panus rudis PR-1116 ss-1]
MSGVDNLHTSTARIYTSYPAHQPPPHPGEAWTRFVCISDTHSRTHYDVPDGDVLLHAGDLSSWGKYKQLRKTVNWLKELPHPVKVIIAGNHDLALDEAWREGSAWTDKVGSAIPTIDVDKAKAMMRSKETKAAGIHYLQHESAEITLENGRTWRFYGSPAAPRYALGAFQYTTHSEAEAIYSRIPPETEILLTHTPVHGHCDLSSSGTHAGCRNLEKHMKKLTRCRLHVYGHIHEAWGAALQESTSVDAHGEIVDRVHVNAAIEQSERAIIVDLLN